MRQNTVEKRRFPRLDYHIPMRYRKIEINAPELKGSLLKNISEGGARMAIYEFLPLNLKLAMEIPLVSGIQPLTGLCRVVWVNKTAYSEQYDAGIEFLDLNPEDTRRLARFIFNKSVEQAL